MAKEKDAFGKLEWRINVPNGNSEKLEPESGLGRRLWLKVMALIVGPLTKICKFLEKAWKLGVSEPKKVIHCLKVGMALSLVSLFYFMRPLYEGVGGNAMWAVMTVVVVFEYTVGATLSKSVNRALGTFLAGSLGVGVHWVANRSGEKYEPVILGFSVFILASAATFSRFIPSVKARFDYGAMIFILTFSLVSVSGYRVDKLIEMAHQRLSTILIGTTICILISMLFCPIWAGNELHLLIIRNLEKLAESLDGSVLEYFMEDGEMVDSEEDNQKKSQGYKCVLNSKATEESMAIFARWEPAHGKFNFRHPWKQYLKIGALIRNCAYCIETLNVCINSDIQAPEYLKNHLSNDCVRLSSHCSNVLKELATIVKTMRKSTTIDISVGEMNFAVQELQNSLKSIPSHHTVLTEAGKGDEKSASAPPLVEVLPLATVALLLIENAARIEATVDAVDELAGLAEFDNAMSEKKPKQNQPTTDSDGTMKTIQRV